jgi:cytochrome c oxidase subunit 1
MCLWSIFSNALYWTSFTRRYYTNTNFPLFDDLQNVNVLITTFALIGGVSIGIFYITSLVVYSMERNQFKTLRSNTLEWTTPVEHIHGNWPGETRSAPLAI